MDYCGYSKEDGNGSFRNIEGRLFFNEVNTNFKSAVVLSEVCLRDFLEKDEGGVIVNIGSINLLHGWFIYFL